MHYAKANDCNYRTHVICCGLYRPRVSDLRTGVEGGHGPGTLALQRWRQVTLGNRTPRELLLLTLTRSFPDVEAVGA